MSLYQGRLITGMKNLFQIRWTYNRGEAITGGDYNWDFTVFYINFRFSETFAIINFVTNIFSIETLDKFRSIKFWSGNTGRIWLNFDNNLKFRGYPERLCISLFQNSKRKLFLMLLELKLIVLYVG